MMNLAATDEKTEWFKHLQFGGVFSTKHDDFVLKLMILCLNN